MDMQQTYTGNATHEREHAGDEQDIVGSWLGTVTATNPPLGHFDDLISFHPGGIVMESRRYSVPGTPLGNMLETSGHGAWVRRGENSFEVFFRFLLQERDTGVPLGTDNIHLTLTLDRHHGTLSGTFQSQIKDRADTALMTVEGNYSATAIVVC